MCPPPSHHVLSLPEQLDLHLNQTVLAEFVVHTSNQPLNIILLISPLTYRLLLWPIAVHQKFRHREIKCLGSEDPKLGVAYSKASAQSSMGLQTDHWSSRSSGG